MKTKLLFLLFGLLNWVAFAAVPTNNPIAAFYNGADGYPVWTNEVKWANVIDMSVYSNGTTNLEKFNNACLEAYNAGGGVLYYPAGTYTFDIPDGPADKGLMLREGVVIRGDQPATDIKANPILNVEELEVIGTARYLTHGLKSMPTKFVFTRKSVSGVGASDSWSGEIPKMWNCIGSTPSTASLIGIAWVQIEYGYIYFGFDDKSWSATWGVSGSYIGTKAVNGWLNRVPNGTHPMDPLSGTKVWTGDTAILGEKRFVFGCHMNNALVPNYAINKAGAADFVVEPNGYLFGFKISVYGSHVFVANNVISKPTACFAMKVTCKGGSVPAGTVVQVPYDYGNGGGIDVNKSYLSGFATRCMIDNPNGYYASNVEIRDNWVYNRANKGFELAGKWIVIKNNINAREYYDGNDPYSLGFNNTIALYHSKWTCLNGETSEDFYSRGFDVGGANMWLDSNFVGGTGTAFTNDGEGILIQRHNGVEAYSFAWTNNNALDFPTPNKAVLSIYDVHAVGLFEGWNNTHMQAGLWAWRDNYGADISGIENYSPETGNILSVGGEAADGTYAYNIKDILSACPGADPLAPDVNVEYNATEKCVVINWVDKTTNEVAYKVERKVQGSTDWSILSYRPRQQTGGSVVFSASPSGTDRTGGYIQNAFGYGNGTCWDGKTRNMNPPEWRDYNAISGVVYEYRVVAINCADNEAGASGNKLIVTNIPSKTVTFRANNIFPNPSNGKITITNIEDNVSIEKVSVYSTQGALLFEQQYTQTGNITLDIPSYKGVAVVKSTYSDGSENNSKIIVQ